MTRRHRMGRRALAMIGGAVVMLGVTMARPSEAAVLVLRAQGPVIQTIFKPGESIRPGQRIELGDNEELWLLDNSGTRGLRGPGLFVLAEGATGAKIGVSSLLEYWIDNGKESRRPIVSGVRGPARSGENQPPLPAPGPAELARLLEVHEIYGGYGRRSCVWGDRIRFVYGVFGARDDRPAALDTATGRIMVRFQGWQSEEVAIDRLTAGSGDVTIEAGGVRHAIQFIRIAPPLTLEGLALDAARADCDITLLGMIRYFKVRD